MAKVPTKKKKPVPPRSTPVTPDRPPKVAISLRIRPELKAGLEALAVRRGIPYQTLMNQWVEDRFVLETHRLRPAELAELMRQLQAVLAQVEQRLHPEPPRPEPTALVRKPVRKKR